MVLESWQQPFICNRLVPPCLQLGLFNPAEMREYLLLSGLLVLLVLISVAPQVSGQDTPCGAGLQCVSAGKCPAFGRERAKLESLTRGSEERAKLLEKLRSLVCNKQERNICCELAGPDSPSYIPSMEKQECGLEGGSAAFVLGGDNTTIGEFPFLGLLGKEKNGKIQWVCGGSIINKWYVLTAAHCGKDVDYVRLGEWKVVDPECERLEYCKGRGESRCGGECDWANEKIDCETEEGVKTCTKPYQVGERRD